MQHEAIKYQVWSYPKSPQTGLVDDKIPRILLAEDNPLDQVSIRRLLEKGNVQVHCVDNGRDAVDEARSGSYDLILMDILMPEMDGFVATLKIREEEQAAGGGGVPIIALTAYSLKAIRDKCRSVGMNGYLSKPMSARELRAVCGLFCVLPPGEGAELEACGTLPILDEEEALENLGGVRPLYDELVDMFIDQTPHLIGHLVDLVGAGDTEATKRYIRRLMVSADTIGAKRLAHLCSHIQSSLDGGNLDDCAQWTAQLPHELELLTNTILLLDRDGL
ncbi:response regulator [Oryzomonas rubra]|uniref:Response regulator n=1 Tax=Oryzomonas rubra TaxID=2509454 RepID=A0A5A9X7Q4_9BACT|nr:response regulator [Oryzomonas rubra]KAA0888824.1 response regulator [Oryzomonas rubra]